MVSELRKNMNIAIKKNIVPVLREQGFKGSFPHFRRKNKNHIDLITFQFNTWGGSFVVELATSPLEGMIMSWGEEIPANKVTAHHVNERHRLGESGGEPGIWFDYSQARTTGDFEQVCHSVLGLLHLSDPNWISRLLG